MSKLKKGDTVIIITGKDRGKTGTIASLLPEKNRVVVTGLNAYKKHTKPTAKTPQGGVITAYRPINLSNVMFLDPETKKPTRLGTLQKAGEKKRISRLTGKVVE